MSDQTYLVKKILPVCRGLGCGKQATWALWNEGVHEGDFCRSCGDARLKQIEQTKKEMDKIKTTKTEQESMLEDLTELFKVVDGCCLMNPVFRPEDVESVLAWHGDRQSQSESQSLVLVKLKDGKFGLFSQGEDYTGHGCQCGSATITEDRLASLLSGIDEWDLIKILQREED